MFVNLLDGANNVVHVLSFSQELPVLEPHRFPAGALSVGTKCFEAGVIDNAVVVAAGDRATVGIEILPEEHGVFVKRVRVTGETSDAFRQKRCQEIGSRNPKLSLVETKDVEMVSVPGGVFGDT